MPTYPNLTALEDDLPSGLHDAHLDTAALDLMEDAATLHLELDIGDPDAPTEAEREARRRATVHLRGLLYFVLNPPAAPERSVGRATAFITRIVEEREDDPSPEFRPLCPLPPGFFAASLYLSDRDSFLRVAAQEVALEWGAPVPYEPLAPDEGTPAG